MFLKDILYTIIKTPKMSILVINLMLVSIVCGHEIGEIFSDYGVITIKNMVNCTISLGNLTYNFTEGNKAPGLWFGLIDYDCIGYRGKLLSELKCKPCGMFCVYNEYLPGCEQKFIPFLFGALTSIIIFTILFIILRSKLFLIVNNMINRYLYKKQLSIDYNTYRNHKKIVKILRVNKEIKFAKINPIMVTKYKNLIEENRNRLAGRVEKFEEDMNDNDKNGIYEKIINKPYADVIKELESMRSRTPSPPPRDLSTLAIVGLTAAHIIGNVSACDEMLYMNSVGKFCNDRDMCENLNVYQTMLVFGSTICFRDMENELFKLSIHESITVQRFQPIYKTSNFEIGIAGVEWECKSRNSICWNKGCNIGDKHEKFKSLGNNTIEDFSCDPGVIGCDTFCYHQVSCTWYHWYLKDIGQKAIIHKKVTQMWKIILRLEYKGKVELIEFNSNKISVNLKDILSDHIKSMPIVITSVNNEDIVTDNYILEDGDNFYSVDANNQNDIVVGKIGEYQIGIREESRSYQKNAVLCVSRTCNPVCSYPPNALERFRKGHREHLRVKVIRNGYGNLLVEYKTSTSINVAFGNVELNNLYIENALCKIKKISSFGCIGCDKKSYVVFQAFEIKTNGILPFESNCTFDVNYLSCNQELYTLNYINPELYCMIYIPKTNQTILLDTDFNYVGKIDAYNIQYKDYNIGDITKEVLTSSKFWMSLSANFITFSVITIVTSFILRGFKIYTAKKSAEKIINNV
nr:MAG: putative glycoprotein [Phasmaviridae sp.]